MRESRPITRQSQAQCYHARTDPKQRVAIPADVEIAGVGLAAVPTGDLDTLGLALGVEAGTDEAHGKLR